MIGRGLILLTMLSTCVLSLPVTSSQLENEDVKVMKCIVEVLADVLSRPHLMTVSQECLVTLKTDDRLVTILRHHKFLKELQEIAVQGGQERAHLYRDAETTTTMTQTLQTADNVADRSMLEALGGPGERSILSQKKRTGNGDGNEEKSNSVEDGESQEDKEVEEVEVKRESDESLGSHVSESVDEWSHGKAEKREEEEEKESDEKRANSEESSEEGNVSTDKRGEGSDEKRDARKKKTNERKSAEEDEEEKDKRSALFSHKRNSKEVEQEEEEEEVKRGSRESLKPWTKRAKPLSLKKKAVGKEVQLNTQQEVPHHSKEVVEEEEEVDVKKKDSQRSLEEKELQMIARRAPEESRGLEEEGSASRKSEEPEIESLAAIESELENVAQKLHELRRG